MQKIFFFLFLFSIQTPCVSENDFSSIFDTQEKKEFAEKSPGLIQTLSLVFRKDSKIESFNWTYRGIKFYFYCQKRAYHKVFISMNENPSYSLDFSRNNKLDFICKLSHTPKDQIKFILDFCILSTKKINTGVTSCEDILYGAILYDTIIPEIV